MPPKINSEHEQARRKQILQAAALCFSKKGYTATSIDAVARRAKLSKGAIYTYFASKEELLLGVVDDQQSGLIEKLAAVLPLQGTALEKIEAYATAYFRLLGEESKSAHADVKVVVQLWGEIAKNAKAVALIRRDYAYWQKTLVALIEEGIAQGEFTPDINVAMTATTLLAVVDGFIWQSLWLGGEFDWEAAGAAFLRLMRAGMLRRDVVNHGRYAKTAAPKRGHHRK